MDHDRGSAVGTAQLQYADGSAAGEVHLIKRNESLELAITVTGMAPGRHGFHLHSVGKCLPPDFKSAGGHLNPDGKTHGKNSLNPAHLGDLPNLDVGNSGKASAQVLIDGNANRVLADIFDQDGTAIVIHAGADDYRSDPAGNAGSRIACGVLRPLGSEPASGR
ncbi:MAG: superoxide dismutase family protein [Sphingomonadaceae bacterium]